MKYYKITGMTCAACQARVEKAVNKVDGVNKCSVSLLTNSMEVDGTVTDEMIINAVEKAGYKAEIKNNFESTSNKKNDNSSQKEKNNMFKRLISSIVFLLILMYFSMGISMWGWPSPEFLTDNFIAQGIIQMLLTIIIMVINQKFFINGFKGLMRLSLNMDTLIALGATISFLYSVYILLGLTVSKSIGHVHFYFESAAMILTFITIGKTLESYTKGRTTDALQGLINLSPKEAIILKNGSENTISIDQVKKGDIFLVRPGGSIPTDGIIIEGEASVDESTLTGESIPSYKKQGDYVYAATINQSGFIKCEATRVGEETTLSQIIKMVSEASSSKAPIAKIADKVSGIFIPIILSISLIVFIVWMIISTGNLEKSLMHAISVLVISCPCALGLATPVAIMVGNGKGAKNGILFKTAESLEQTGKTSIIALDKTGTITQGKPEITDIITFNGINENDLLLYAYALEIKSEHPLANAIKKSAIEKNIPLVDTHDFKVFIGNGIEAYINKDKLIGGSYTFIKSIIKLNNEEELTVKKISSQGKTPLLFIKNDLLLGIIGVSDVIKKDSIVAIEQLKKLGYHTVMLTGDNKKSAEIIGELVGIDEVISEVLPDEKEEKIKQLKQKGKVIMVGDGINDAPALTTADIGIAIGAGTDIAIDAANIVLMNNSLLDVPAAIRLSRYTIINIYENLFWAFIYNIIGIPLAAGAFGLTLDPMYGALAMSLSSIFVVVNALRLNTKKIYIKEKNKKEMKTMIKTIHIEGMMCQHCEEHIKKALLKIDGVINVEASFKDKIAIVTLNKIIDDDVFKNVINEEGYEFIKIA